MRLRTLESFWLIKNGLLYSYPSVRENAEAEVVVIGGGITGALTAHALLDRGYQVLLIDRRDIGLGSTAATTSMLQYEIDVPLYKLIELIGTEAAVRCYRAGIQAIHDLKHLIEDTAVDCGFESKQSLYIAHSSDAARWLRTEYEARERAELGVHWLNAAQVKDEFSLHCHGAILSDTAASVDAYRLAHELIHRNVGRGLAVYDQTGIRRIEQRADSMLIITKDNYIIRCRKIICCTGFEAREMLPEPVAELFYTYAVISEQHIGLPPRLRHMLIWDTDNPYLYMRGTDDNRLLAGGEDTLVNFPYFQRYIKKSKGRKLIKKIESILPDIHFIDDFTWGGVFGATKDGLPYIGPSPNRENIYFVLGYGGNGITFSVQAMDIIPELLAGRSNALAAAYRFGR